MVCLPFSLDPSSKDSYQRQSLAHLECDSDHRAIVAVPSSMFKADTTRDRAPIERYNNKLLLNPVVRRQT